MVGMIDWLTLRLHCSFLPDTVQRYLIENTARVLKVSADGEMIWETNSSENISSDSHHVTVRFGEYLEILGSPARVSQKHNVFGTLDIQECFYSMVRFVQSYFGFIFPINIHQWKCTRIDVTRNYDLGSIESVKEALDALKSVRVGRQKMTTYDTTVNWGAGSSLHSGKIYAKGPDLARNVSRGRAFCSEHELMLANQLLRLEYSLRRHMIQRIKDDSGMNWQDFTPAFLITLHDQYFAQFISEAEVIEVDDVLHTLKQKAQDGEIATEGQAHAAYDCYVRCKSIGIGKARASYRSKATWYRHLKNLRAIGVNQIDLQQSSVVPIKRKTIVLNQPVSSWDEIRQVRA